MTAMRNNRIIFESPTGAEKGSEQYFHEAMDAGFYGVPDDESYAFKVRAPKEDED